MPWSLAFTSKFQQMGFLSSHPKPLPVVAISCRSAPSLEALCNGDGYLEPGTLSDSLPQSSAPTVTSNILWTVFKFKIHDFRILPQQWGNN